MQGCRNRYGVGTVGHAVTAGITSATFYRRTNAEGWTRPDPGVRVAPWARPSRLTELSALLHAAGDHALASGETAAWLYRLAPEPRKLQVCLPHGKRVPRAADGLVRRCHWLADADRATVGNLRVLGPAAMIITLATSDPLTLRARLIDARHRNQIQLSQLTNRLACRSSKWVMVTRHSGADTDATPWVHCVSAGADGLRYAANGTRSGPGAANGTRSVWVRRRSGARTRALSGRLVSRRVRRTAPRRTVRDRRGPGHRCPRPARRA